eukprot:CAMPEP_0168561524 /NCGR_PEP_ID=MMETSP0413-20121227/11639_1 /TAXON_ID=136452 /ORGANISM="Filamoeba nolandi, Strain NC-AS-23-1" /LENGTH=391 /DNA_ID=CAMNT_0008592897 /DNA_START=66 /DNA_END=1238 /DNA_ORIENTATION=-
MRGRVHLVPILVFSLSISTVLITYIWYQFISDEDHEDYSGDVFLPTISETGDYPPQSCIFTFGLSNVSVLLMLIVFVKFLQIQETILKERQWLLTEGAIDFEPHDEGIAPEFGIKRSPSNITININAESKSNPGTLTKNDLPSSPPKASSGSGSAKNIAAASNILINPSTYLSGNANNVAPLKNLSEQPSSESSSDAEHQDKKDTAWFRKQEIQSQIEYMEVRLRTLNKINFTCGIVACVCLNAVASFQSNNAPWMHYPAAIIFFVCIFIYISINTFFGYKIHGFNSMKQKDPEWLLRLRLGIVISSGVLLVIGMLLGLAWLASERDSIWSWLAVSEWCISFSCFAYILSYSLDFKELTLRLYIPSGQTQRNFYEKAKLVDSNSGSKYGTN